MWIWFIHLCVCFGNIAKIEQVVNMYCVAMKNMRYVNSQVEMKKDKGIKEGTCFFFGLN